MMKITVKNDDDEDDNDDDEDDDDGEKWWWLWWNDNPDNERSRKLIQAMTLPHEHCAVL